MQNKLHWAIHGQTAAEVILSRADPAFVLKLFRLEVSEISDGTIEVRNACRTRAGDVDESTGAARPVAGRAIFHGHRYLTISSSSTSKVSIEFGGIGPPPLSP